MGLYVPNVKMPTSCCECYDAGLVAAQIVLGEGCPFCKQIGPPNAGLDKKRELDCPLIYTPDCVVVDRTTEEAQT